MIFLSGFPSFLGFLDFRVPRCSACIRHTVLLSCQFPFTGQMSRHSIYIKKCDISKVIGSGVNIKTVEISTETRIHWPDPDAVNQHVIIQGVDAKSVQLAVSALRDLAKTGSCDIIRKRKLHKREACGKVHYMDSPTNQNCHVLILKTFICLCISDTVSFTECYTNCNP